jgi:hypothetical protein
MSARATLLLGAQIAVNLALWIPLPLGVLWVAAQLQYQSGSLLLGVLAGFALLSAGISAGMRLVRRIDASWVAASGQAWRDAALGYIATACAVGGGGGFSVWLLLFGGMQSSLFPSS